MHGSGVPPLYSKLQGQIKMIDVVVICEDRFQTLSSWLVDVDCGTLSPLASLSGLGGVSSEEFMTESSTDSTFGNWPSIGCFWVCSLGLVFSGEAVVVTSDSLLETSSEKSDVVDVCRSADVALMIVLMGCQPPETELASDVKTREPLEELERVLVNVVRFVLTVRETSSTTSCLSAKCKRKMKKPRNALRKVKM